MGYFDADAQEMLDVYLLETHQLIGQLADVLLETEKNGVFTGDDIHNIFRVMHTIKSSSAMMGLSGLSSLAHKLEDLFAFYREMGGRIDQAEAALFDLLFAASDFVEQELEVMTRQDYRPADTQVLEARATEYLERIRSASAVDGAPGSKETEENPEAEGDKARSEAPVPGELMNRGGTVVRLRLEPECRMENVRVFMLVRQISGLCGQVETFPRDIERSEATVDYIKENGAFIRFETDKRDEVLETLKNGLFVESCKVEWEAPLPEAEKKAEIPAAESGREAEFLSVRTERLDQLQSLAGEMMIQMLLLDEALDQSGLLEVKEGIAHQINRLVTQVERTVMAIRMVPVERIVPKLRRILRDICRDQKKEVELVVNCGDIEADTGVVDIISEAMMHMLRNAVDHGIEAPEERAAAGKDRKGKITFTVESTVGELIVSLEDDGCGIDIERVREQARAKGLFVRPEETYDRQEVISMILCPGFTTSDAVTEYSGRGVGLDVVKNILEGVGGNLYIQSERGNGTCFTLTMPLTLANMECVRFKVGDYRMSVPARQVFQFLDYDASRDSVRLMGEREYILYENRMVPFIDLRKLYCLGGEAPENSIVIYVQGKNREGCILADSLYEQKRIVIKQLPALFGIDFRRNTGVSGCSIMGDGKICAALDVEVLISRYEKEGAYASRL